MDGVGVGLMMDMDRAEPASMISIPGRRQASPGMPLGEGERAKPGRPSCAVERQWGVVA